MALPCRLVTFCLYVTGLLCALLCECASRTLLIQPHILYQNDRLTPEQFSGQSVTLFPVFTKQGFETSAMLGDSIQAVLIKDIRQDLTLYAQQGFERLYLQAHDSVSLKHFYARIFQGDIIGLQTSDTMWKTMPSRYLLLIRFANGTRVKTLDEQVLRRLDLEAELWDARTAEVVMRLAVNGSDSQARTPDGKFFHATLSALLRQLPGVRHVELKENW
jgi:hypothetical protein